MRAIIVNCSTDKPADVHTLWVYIYYVEFITIYKWFLFKIYLIKPSVFALLYTHGSAGPLSSDRDFNEHRWLRHPTSWRHDVKFHHCKDPKSHFSKIYVRIGYNGNGIGTQDIYYIIYTTQTKYLQRYRCIKTGIQLSV